MTKTITYTLPESWACPLINGDYSGCSDEEEKEINDWLDRRKGRISGCVGIKPTGTLTDRRGDKIDLYEGWFQHGHDANRNQGATVLEFIFWDLTEGE